MARPTVRILSRYILRQHVAPLAFALAALTSFLLIQQVSKQLANMVGKGLPASVVLEVFVLSVPFIIAMTLPMAVLVAVLHAFTRLGGDNEITAMKAGGVSVGRMLAPVLGGAAVVSLLSLLWSDQVLPRSNHRLRTLLGDIQRTRPSLTLKEQVINPVRQEFFLRAARIDQASNKLKDVTIYDLGDPERRRIISADSGRMAYTPGGRDLYLTLFDGEIREAKRQDPTQFNRTFYLTNRIRVAGIGDIFERTLRDEYRGDREMSICDMEQRVLEAKREADAARAEARRTVTNDLRRLAGLAPDPAVASPRTAGTAPPRGAYCRLLATVGGWARPRAATAQDTLPPPTPDRPGAGPAGRPPSAGFGGPLITAGAPFGEEQRARVARQRGAMYAVEIHKKFAISAACLVFALLAVPVALRFPRGGIGLVIAVSAMVWTVYYVGLIGGEELGDRLIVSPVVAMWAPNLICAVLGLAGVWSVRRASRTAHGAEWLQRAWRGVQERLVWLGVKEVRIQ